jgi:hypothetical protein
MLVKLKNLLITSKEEFDRIVQKVKAIDDVPMPKYKILVMNRSSREFKSREFYSMKDAMNFASPEYLYDIDNEYFLMDLQNPKHGMIKLNKLEANGKNERSVHAEA